MYGRVLRTVKRFCLSSVVLRGSSGAGVMPWTDGGLRIARPHSLTPLSALRLWIAPELRVSRSRHFAL